MLSKELVIRPQSAWLLFDIKEIIAYRELFYTFVWRNFKIRYKQTVLGIAWVVFQPIVSTAIFSIFFGNLAKIPSGRLPYSLFTLCGLVFWTFFSSSLSYASESMVMNDSIIKKVYFPKIILPLAAVVTSLIDFIINFMVLLLYSLILGYFPNLQIILLMPFILFFMLLTVFGLGMFTAAVNVKYRDVRYILPFFIQILLFLTPVIYSLDIISLSHRYMMALNPFTSIIELTRSMFSGSPMVSMEIIVISVFSSFIIFFFGLWYFNKTERYFADIV